MRDRQGLHSSAGPVRVTDMGLVAAAHYSYLEDGIGFLAQHPQSIGTTRISHVQVMGDISHVHVSAYGNTSCGAAGAQV
jgi:hypothetical protein